MKNVLFILSLILIVCTSCDKDDDTTNQAENTYASLSNISGEEGSRIIVTQNNEELIFSGSNVLGWSGGQLLNLNYYSTLRLLHDDFETIGIWFSVPQGLNFVDTAVGSHGLHGFTVQLQDTQNLDGPIVEMYLDTAGPGDRPQFFGDLEIRRSVEHLGTVYDMVGTFEITREGQTVKGLFWKKEVANW
ncbi:MAG: hypothetical protein AB8B52_14940 [Winogradskyella sp.]|uniref:hypothetical protein n=1 Tax=Winogradskyella sp. TaxID=1883156 RepID=UPI0038592F59